MWQPRPLKPKMPLWAKVVIGGVVTATIVATIGLAQYKPSGHAGAGVHSVTYQADTGSSKTGWGSITMQTPTGISQQNVDLPMQTTDGKWLVFTDFQRGDSLYLSVQGNEDTTTVTCRILVDGKKVSENVATGAYSIATCKGSAAW
jgi:hypothetical protein